MIIDNFSSFFYRLIVVQLSFCRLMKGITPEIPRLCFILINSVLVNLFMPLDLVVER